MSEHEALRRINMAKERQDSVLNLEGLGLQTLPESLGQLTYLTKLGLGNNQLTTLPSFIRKLKRLEALDLSNNQLTVLPPFFTELSQLKYLDLLNTQLTTSPELLGELKQLQMLRLHLHKSIRAKPLNYIGKLEQLHALYLYRVLLPTLPDFITNLVQLRVLHLESVQLETLPESLVQLNNLQSLDIGHNKLRFLPSFIGKLRQLQQLNLNANELSVLPEDLTELDNLRSLNLSDNKYTELPQFITDLKKLEVLHLRRMPLKVIPQYLTKLNKLRFIDFSETQLSEIPKCLVEFAQLQWLCLRGNQLTDLPAYIGDLDKLKSLDLIENQLTKLPDALTRLSKLETLKLDSNRLTEFPVLIGELKTLRELSIGNNGLKSLPGFIGELKELRSLFLRGNQFTSLPESLTKLQQLEALYLDGNRLASLPESIGELTNLKELTIGSNNITALPESIGNLKWVTDLHLGGNPIETPPMAIASRGIAGIRAYFDEIKEKGFDYLYEAKLLIVGDPGVGKSTLFNKLLDPDYPVPNNREITVGVNVSAWNFPMQTDKPEHGNLFRANLWDFGGQDIQYMTHHFFLTSRSLYVLVIADSIPHSNFDYWLNIINALSNKSPVIVVQNEMGHGVISKHGLDHYYENYPNMIKDYRDIDFSRNDDGRGTVLVNTLKTHLQNLDHIGEKLPKQWIAVRNVLECKSVNEKYIAFETYKTICEQNGLMQEEQQLNLSGYLHDLGVVLHFQHDEDIALWVVLDPQWIVDAVYSILADNVLESLGGHMDRDWLFDKWNDVYDFRERSYLLSLMLKNRFDICYAIDADKGKYIVPLLLPSKTPLFRWDHKNNLRFRYQYQFMPYGLISRIIVRLSGDIENVQNTPLNWKTGVVLGSGTVRAWVEENLTEQGLKVLDIRLAGEEFELKGYLSWIRKEIGQIHQESYDGITPEQLVPCPACLADDVASPNYILYSQLNTFVRAGNDILTCGVCGKKYSPRNLLDGVSCDGETNERSGPHIRAGDHANITIVEDGGHNYSGTFHVDSQNLNTVSARPWSSIITEWRLFSIACGLVAVFFAVILLLLPLQWQIRLSGLTGIFFLVTVFMLSIDPARFYRRLLSYVIPIGLLLNSVGGSINLYASTTNGDAWLMWDREVNVGFLVVWVIIVGMLVWADQKQKR